MYSAEHFAPIRRKKLLKLVEISTNKCIQNVANLQDIGSTPFHLLRPILKRMTAKQLNKLEIQSPQITPESDELWPDLIEKEFPDRPLYNKTINVNSKEYMPNKSLYYKYSQERELFRRDSAERLRDITKKLKLQKSANSIVAVPQLLKDPTVRRKNFSSGYSRQTSNPNRNSILNKARKEIQSRALMFPGYSQKVKKYDPYDAFKRVCSGDNNSIRSSKLHSKPVRETVKPIGDSSSNLRVASLQSSPSSKSPSISRQLPLNSRPSQHSHSHIHSSSSTAFNSFAASNNNTKNNNITDNNTTNNNSTSNTDNSDSNEIISDGNSTSTIGHSSASSPSSVSVNLDSTPTPPPSQPPKKRKSEPSIFLTRNKRQRIPRTELKKSSSTQLYENNKEESAKRIKPIRSSIFS